MKLTQPLPIWSNLTRGLLFAVTLVSTLTYGEAWAAPKYVTFLLNFQQIQSGVLTAAEVMPQNSTSAYIAYGSTLPFVYDPAHPTAIIIPEGVTHARLSGTVCWGFGAVGGSAYLIRITANGQMLSFSSEYPTVMEGFPYSNITSAITAVQPGSTLQIELGFNGEGSTFIQGDESYWTLEMW